MWVSGNAQVHQAHVRVAPVAHARVQVPVQVPEAASAPVAHQVAPPVQVLGRTDPQLVAAVAVDLVGVRRVRSVAVADGRSPASRSVRSVQSLN